MVNAAYEFRLKVPGSFFTCLPDDSIEQCFFVFQVTGRLVIDRFTRDILLDHEKAAVILNQGGNSQVRFPRHILILSVS